MRFRALLCFVALTSLAALAAACGSDEPDAAGAGASGEQFVGRVPPPTPTLAPALAEATQAASVPYRGAVSGGVETGELTAEQARDYIGKQGKICGTVMASVHEPEHRLKLTFLNIDKAEDPDFFVFFPYIGQRFGNWPDVKDSTVDLTTWFNDKNICVQGRIALYRDKPAISTGQWHQIEIRQ